MPQPDFGPDEAAFERFLRQPASNCPPLELLLAAGQEVLPADAEQRLQQHLRHCSLCTNLLADLATMPEATFSNAQQQRIASSLSKSMASNSSGPISPIVRSKVALFATAALLLISATAITTYRLRSRPAPSEAKSVALPPMPAVASLQIPISPLAPPAPSATSLLMRGERADANPSTDLLLPGFEAYNRGDYRAAVRAFAPLMNAYPQSDIVPLYLGVSQLLLHQDDRAFDTLGRARQKAQPQRADDAAWYLAVATERVRPSEALALFSSICVDKKSHHREQSCRIAGLLHPATSGNP